MLNKLTRRGFLTTAAALSPYAMFSGCAVAAPQQFAISPEAELYSSNYPSLKLAMQDWVRVGGTLVIDQDHNEPDNIYISLQPNRSYRLTTDGPRSVNYTGRHYHWFIRILSMGSNPFSFSGDLTIDGQNNVNMPFWAQFDFVEGNARRDCIFDGRFICQNARMKSGTNAIDGASNSAYDATCMKFSGGFETLRLKGVQAISAGRDAGLVVAGQRGCRGIAITSAIGTTKSPKHIHVSDFIVDGVVGDDEPGSIAAPECDGLLIFKAAEIDASEPIVERGLFKECLGRALKLYSPAGGGIARELKVERSKSLMGAIDINFQHGDGLVENVEIDYSGTAHGTTKVRFPTVPVSMASSYSRPKDFPFRPTIVRNISIKDTTGVSKQQVIGLSYAQKETVPRRITLENIYDGGISDVLFRPAAMGRYQKVFLDIRDINVNLAVAVSETDDPLFYMQVKAQNFMNRSAIDRPVLTLLNGKQRTVEWGQWESKGTLQGVHRVPRRPSNIPVLQNGFVRR